FFGVGAGLAWCGRVGRWVKELCVAVEMVERVVDVGGIELVTLEGGSGRPLLMLHDELGFPGWLGWNEDLAGDRRFVIPLQPGFGRTPRVPWFGSMRDVGAFYARM